MMVMRTRLLGRALPLVTLAAALSCSESSKSEPADAPPGDAAADAAVDASADASSCEGACKTTTLAVSKGSLSKPIERAQYGLVPPAASSTGDWAIRFELHAGGEAACPTQSSPTPDRTIVIAGVPHDATKLSLSDGMSVSLFDFDASFTSEPLVRATSATIEVGARSLCTECFEPKTSGPLPRYVAFDLAAAFGDVHLEGHGFAEHCDTLDDPG